MSRKRPADGSTFCRDKWIVIVDNLCKLDPDGVFRTPRTDQSEDSPDVATVRDNLTRNRYNSDAEVEDDICAIISRIAETPGGEGTFAKQLKRQLKAEMHAAGIDTHDTLFIATEAKPDNETTLAAAEAENLENVTSVLRAMEADLETPLDVLRERLAAAREATDTSDSTSATSDDGSTNSDTDESDTTITSSSSEE